MGIKVDGVWINNISYADDTVLIADKMDDLQQMVNKMGEHSKSMGQIKLMVISRECIL